MNVSEIIKRGGYCSGCSACLNRCPKRCISMTADSEGFLYPKVDESECIDCGLCERVCHEQHPYEERAPIRVCAAINRNEKVRMDSSSGGIFHLLAEKTIAEGGVVFGARFDGQWQVVIDYAETLDGVRPFMGSKYVQARIATAYKDAQTFLRQGRRVLFSGSPCQIAGLHHYLGRRYDNLTTVDFVCHGVPSPKVWGRYLDEVVASGRKAINDIRFRNKNNGWKRFNFQISYDKPSGQLSISGCHRDNHYMRAFLSNMILRPSCHECRAKQGRSHSDITIADFWGIGQIMPDMDDDKGTGLVIINSEKGMSSLDWSCLTYRQATLASASRCNGGLSSYATPHPKRYRFFSRLDNTSSVTGLIDDCLRPPLRVRIKMTLARVKGCLRSIVFSTSGG